LNADKNGEDDMKRNMFTRHLILFRILVVFIFTFFSAAGGLCQGPEKGQQAPGGSAVSEYNQAFEGLQESIGTVLDELEGKNGYYREEISNLQSSSEEEIESLREEIEKLKKEKEKLSQALTKREFSKKAQEQSRRIKELEARIAETKEQNERYRQELLEADRVSQEKDSILHREIAALEEEIGSLKEEKERLRQLGKEVVPVQDEAAALKKDVYLTGDRLEKALLEPVTLDYFDLELSQVLRTLSDGTDINIVSGPMVKGKVTIHLVDVPLGAALKSILLSNNYTYVKEGDILRVIPLSEMDRGPVRLESLAVEVFNLQYASADDVKNTVEKFLSEFGSIQSFSRTTKGSVRARSSTLVIRDTQQAIDNIRRIIRSLDIERPQVSIQARVVELIADDDDQLGIDWTVTGTLTGSTVPTTLPFMANRNSIDGRKKFIPEADPAGGGDDEEQRFGPGNIFPFSSSNDFTFGTLDFSSFQAVWRMLDSKDNSNLLSAPHISALEGEEAMITVGTNIPIPIYERNEETGSMEVTGYEVEETGVILTVTPYIVGEGKIMLQLHPEVSELTGQFVGPNNERPITTSREADTTITVRDGDTVVIGGLVKENVVEEDHKIPLLGYIPFLGAPFRYTSKTVDKTELLIFVTPRIIRHNRFHIAEDFKNFPEKPQGIRDKN
jgi:type IV pilus assembly protein PilQ